MKTSGSMNLTDRVAHNLKAAGLEPGRITLITGVSGGVDSMTLLAVLRLLRIEVITAHINYGKRGLESEKDEALVRDYTRTHDIQFESRKAVDFDGNFQAAARTFRYHFYRDLKEKYHATAIALAHHYDDQVETVLLKVLRGAGPSSWQGMGPADGDIVRPLLDSTRSEIEAFAAENGVPWREDASNRLPEYARNLIRLELVPRFNELLPGWQANVLKLPERGRVTEELLDGELRRWGGGSEFLPDEALAGKTEVTRAAVFAHFLSLNQVVVSESQLIELSRADGVQTGRCVGPLMRDRGGWRMAPATQDTALPDIHFVELALIPERWEDDALYVDASRAPMGALHVRRWQQGDRIQPLGMKGTANVSDLITNKKIRADQKHQVRVVTGLDETIVAVIFPHPDSNGRMGVIAEPFRADASTQTLIQITLNRTTA